MFRLVVLLSFDLFRSNSFHVNTWLGVGHHWWLDYPGLLLDAEFEVFCLSGYVGLVALAVYCLDSVQPAGLPQ